MRARSLLLVIPILWILATSFTQVSGHPWSSNRATLNRLGAWIARFQKEQNRLPDTLSELRTFAYSFDSLPTLYDSYGQHIFYQPLTDVAYVLKSFGRDMTENTVLITRDESISHGLNFPAPGLKSATVDESRLNFYQSAFLEGFASPRGPLIASLKARRGDGKRLLIQSRANREFFMIAFHDAVEEFMWLPGGYELIYTAQGSHRYEDGLYYWNLTTGQVTNLLPKLRDKYFPKLKEDGKLYLSLSHASNSPSFLYLFAAEIPADAQISPKAYYRYGNFFAINPRGDFAIERVASEKDFSIFEYGVDHDALIDDDSLAEGAPAQKDWQALPLAGDKQELLEAWQSYCSNHSDSPGLPYALWWLASIYNDTYRELLRIQPEKARIIRNYGLEIIEALSALPSTPLYLRGFADHLKKNLLLSKPADYNVASMGQEPDESANNAEPEKAAP